MEGNDTCFAPGKHYRILTADVEHEFLAAAPALVVASVAPVAAPVPAREPLEDERVAAGYVRPGPVVVQGRVVQHPAHLLHLWVGPDVAHQPDVVVLFGLAAVFLLDEPERHLGDVCGKDKIRLITEY